MYIIAGLGNPERKYENTRHNVGFDALDVLASRHGIAVDTRKHKGLIGKGTIGAEKVILVKPQTYMNLSGECIREVAEYYGVPADHIIVLCDDIYLDLGVLRIRPSGSAGGHNGLKNIILKLSSENFPRVRIAVGQKPERMDLAAYVLSHFSKEERELVDESVERAAKAVETILSDGVNQAMNLYNGKRA